MSNGKKSTQQKSRRKRRNLQVLGQNPLHRFARECKACGVIGAYDDDVLCYECCMVQERTNEATYAESDPDADTEFNIDNF